MNVNKAIEQLTKLANAGHGDEELVISTYKGDLSCCESISHISRERIGISDMYGDELIIITDLSTKEINNDISEPEDAVVMHIIE